MGCCITLVPKLVPPRAHQGIRAQRSRTLDAPVPPPRNESERTLVANSRKNLADAPVAATHLGVLENATTMAARNCRHRFGARGSKEQTQGCRAAPLPRGGLVVALYSSIAHVIVPGAPVLRGA
ncbi:hypothetical protein MN608_10826 [Microdochium nivale]|nr:hypothetical protein MN608_10826 [Microdochium nivale]